MQRVAMELDASFDRLDLAASYDTIVLKTSWKLVHILTVPFLIYTYFRLRLLIKRREVDVILFSSMVTASLAVLLKRALRANRVKAAAIVHGQDVTKPVRVYQLFLPKVFKALDLVMPVSAATGEACQKRGLPIEKLHVVHNGVKLDRFSPCEFPAGARESHPFRASLPAGSLLLASVGRQVRRKGFAWFIEHVMPQLPDHVHYWLGGDGEEGDAILQAIAAHDLGDRVRLLGRLGEGDLTRLYQSADLFLMPNIPVPGDMEGFGIVMLEAAMNGLPSIAARLEGIKEVISEGKNGCFIESRDHSGFVERITHFDSNRNELASLSQASTQYVAATFGWDAVATNYYSALKRLFNARVFPV